MSDGRNRLGFVTPNDPELFRPLKANYEVCLSAGNYDFDGDVIPETQYNIGTYRYVSPYKRDDAIVHFDLNGKSFFKKVFKAFPLSKIIQFRFNKDQLDATIEQTKTYSFSVTMEKDIFDAYNTTSEDVLLSISSKLFLHIINRLNKDGDLMRFFYNGEGSDLTIDILGCGEFISQYIPTISISEYKKLSMFEVEKDLEIVISPVLLSRVLKHVEKSMKLIMFSFLSETFEIVLKGKDNLRIVNVCYDDSTYIYKVTRLKNIILEYPLVPFTKIQKALRVGNEVNFSIYRNGLINITIFATDMKGSIASFELYVVPKI